jgi:hypothetical protein
VFIPPGPYARFLGWESQPLDLQKIRLAQQTTDEDAQRMSGQLGIQTGTQAPKGMCMIAFNLFIITLSPGGFGPSLDSHFQTLPGDCVSIN